MWKIENKEDVFFVENTEQNQFKKPLCQDIMFGIGDYKELDHLEGYVIYSDPPYQLKKEFDISPDFDHKEFWETMRQWSQKNIVLISELEAPDDFECIWQQEVSRSIKAQDKSKAVEKLWRYKGSTTTHLKVRGL